MCLRHLTRDTLIGIHLNPMCQMTIRLIIRRQEDSFFLPFSLLFGSWNICWLLVEGRTNDYHHLIQDHKHDVLYLLKTKLSQDFLSYHISVSKHFFFLLEDFAHNFSLGVGEILIKQNKDKIHFNPTTTIDLLIYRWVLVSGFLFFCLHVSMDNDSRDRLHLQESLRSNASLVDASWIVMDDFNSLLFALKIEGEMQFLSLKYKTLVIMFPSMD